MDIGTLIKEINELEEYMAEVNKSLDYLGAAKKDSQGQDLDAAQRVLNSNKEIVDNFLSLKKKVDK
tara:strand:+ start:30 stop:227 length:198 start_codon:yes stop_codon:yes gene_type:complete